MTQGAVLTHRVVTSSSYDSLEAEIAAFLHQHQASEMLILGASRGATDDMLWAAAPGGAIGVHRFTLAQAAAVLSAPVLAERGLQIANHFASEAVAARVVHDLREKHLWTYFGPVAGTPGFARALMATLRELRLGCVTANELEAHAQPKLDSGITPLFPVPNFPSYPSNHSTNSTARCEILAYLFPKICGVCSSLRQGGWGFPDLGRHPLRNG